MPERWRYRGQTIGREQVLFLREFIAAHPGHRRAWRARPPVYGIAAKSIRSSQLAIIAASLGILIGHTPPYQPEGRGKIERYFRSVREQFLANLDPKVLLSIEQLNERLWRWNRHGLSPQRT